MNSFKVFLVFLIALPVLTPFAIPPPLYFEALIHPDNAENIEKITALFPGADLLMALNIAVVLFFIVFFCIFLPVSLLLRKSEDG